MKELVRVSMIDDDGTYIIGICDVQRFNDLIKKKEQFFHMQMSGADFVLINKADLAKPGQIEEMEKYIHEQFPDKKVMAVSAKDGTNMDAVYEMMK